MWLRNRFWTSIAVTCRDTTPTSILSSYATLRRWSRPLTLLPTSSLRSCIRTLNWSTRYKWDVCSVRCVWVCGCLSIVIQSLWKLKTFSSLRLVNSLVNGFYLVCFHGDRFVHSMLTRPRTCETWTPRTLISWSQSVVWSFVHPHSFQRWGKVCVCVGCVYVCGVCVCVWGVCMYVGGGGL